MSDFSNPDDVLFRLLVTVDDVWVGLAALAFTLFVVLLVCGVLFRDREDRPVWLNRLQVWLRAEEMNSGLFLAVAALCLIGAGLWLALLLVLVTGLFSLLVTVPDLRPSEVKPGDFRFLLAQIAGLTAVLGAVVALPFTVIRLRLSQKQSQTAQAALFNTKITEAAADLHAMRQVSKEVDGKWETVWEDDVVRRNAAIDRLEGLVREEPGEAGRVSRLLSVYVRELSKNFPAQKPPTSGKVQSWAKNLKPARSDLEHAVQTLGQLSAIVDVSQNELSINLFGANLQGMDLSKLNFAYASLKNVNFDGVRLFMTSFSRAHLRSATFHGCRLIETSFVEADLCEVNFGNCFFFKTNCSGARFDDTSLHFVQIHSCDATGAYFENIEIQWHQLSQMLTTGASVKYSNFDVQENRQLSFGASPFLLSTPFTEGEKQRVRYECLSHLAKTANELFGDGSVTLPEEIERPTHWVKSDLSDSDFNTQWRVWAKTKGVDIPH
ncbi:Secreted effector protein pipB2 [Pelagimonas phthalicica]|uniref:Secreted effector protein pipB2 n=1 Tax=Pelagimonas phthalicica TaxID=1037362 RepID=A0A238JFG6_9RHOB|nr:pentapeptide repeat-containing protein [Pelagimonas phthalicica]TDS91847.1 uncharacterized protein YjbI with pentapeptide repeats [Pelagimonas phthalicica]SMX28897.1 Secreted effector protein pipB2 [Pelagimonas phthalicica]